MAAETVTPGSGAMFDRIAPRYDLLNRCMSLGLDRRWRRRLVSAVVSGPDGHFLDLATGTGDVAILLARAAPGARVRGLDPSEGMLALGRAKVLSAGLAERVTLVAGEATRLPFESGAFDGVTMAFGIRNVADRPAALREMVRVTRPGGTIAILELGEPSNPLARWHVHHVVPRLGAWLSGAGEYGYLQRSIEAFPLPEHFVAILRACGVVDPRVLSLTLGTAHLYTGRVP